MLRIARGLQHPDIPVSLTVGLRTIDGGKATQVSLNAVPTEVSDEERRALLKALVADDGRLVFNPGDNADAASGGPIVRFDCKWVTWLTGEGDAVLPALVMATGEEVLPNGGFVIGAANVAQ
jgi:hypothetical protein